MAAQRAMTSREWAILIALSVVWGGSFLFVGVAVKALPPLTIVALRVSLAALALLAFTRVTGVVLPKSRQAWVALAGMALLNNIIPFNLIVWSQGRIPGGRASILNATMPLFTVIVAHLLTNEEKATPGKLAGLVVGFAGVALMIGPSAVGGAGADVPAQLAVLVGALFYAFSAVYGRRFRVMGLEPIVVATGQMTSAAAVMVPLALIVDRPWTLPVPGLPVFASVLALALVSTSFAYVLFFQLLATAGAVNLALVTFLIPVSAIALGAAVLGERLEPLQFVGLAIIAVGLSAIDGRLWARLLRRPATSSA